MLTIFKVYLSKSISYRFIVIALHDPGKVVTNDEGKLKSITLVLNNIVQASNSCGGSNL